MPLAVAAMNLVRRLGACSVLHTGHVPLIRKLRLASARSQRRIILISGYLLMYWCETPSPALPFYLAYTGRIRGIGAYSAKGVWFFLGKTRGLRKGTASAEPSRRRERG